MFWPCMAATGIVIKSGCLLTFSQVRQNKLGFFLISYSRLINC